MLQESFWDDDASASTMRFMVVDAATGAVNNYALSNEAYTDSELDNALREQGLEAFKRFPSLSGRPVDGESDMPVIVEHR